jgi:hypothetical protein
MYKGSFAGCRRHWGPPTLVSSKSARCNGCCGQWLVALPSPTSSESSFPATTSSWSGGNFSSMVLGQEERQVQINRAIGNALGRFFCQRVLPSKPCYSNSRLTE